MNGASLDRLSHGLFAGLLQTIFSVQTRNEEKVPLRLVTATAAKGTANGPTAGPRFETFSLLFHGPGNRPLEQRTYACEHDRIGRFDLFIVPVGIEGGEMQYEAVFNRVVPPGDA
jgi:hypothetical protein